MVFDEFSSYGGYGIGIGFHVPEMLVAANVQSQDENLLCHDASHVTCNAFTSLLGAGRTVSWCNTIRSATARDASARGFPPNSHLNK